MAWTVPKTWVATEVLTADDLNLYLRDNLNTCEVPTASSVGGLIVADGPNSLVERVGATNTISTSEDTTSTSYADLTTVGPMVTVTTGSRMLVFLTLSASMSAANVSWNAGIDITGADVIPVTDSRSIQMDGILDDQTNRMGITFLYDDLTPGQHTIKLKYKVASGTGSFSDRSLSVVPF